MPKRTLFAADDGVNGQALWITDGTAAGTVLLKDIRPGVGSPSIGNFAALGTNKVVFTADDGVSGVELWVSDGTAAGTVRVRDIAPGAAGSNPAGFVELGGRVYFVADNGVSGGELWVSDGTAAGTVLVKDIFPGVTGSGILGMSRLGDRLVFQATDGANGAELWVSDGTAAGTTLLKDIAAGASSTPSQFVKVGNQLLFQATDTINGLELWTTDGTPAGTMLLKDIRPGSASSAPVGLFAFGNKALFRADNGVNGPELWISDGTAAGTILLKDISPGGGSSFAEFFTQVGDKVFFRANSPGVGFELWVTDGTEAGTVLVKDITGNSGSSSPGPFTVFGNKIVFQAMTSANGSELWISDGTATGTVLLKDIRPGTGSSTPTDFEVVGDKLVFRADDGVNGSELWVTDGTTAGTTLLDIVDPRTTDSFPIPLSIFGNKIIFPADDGVHGNELWISDGTAAGTMLVKDVRPGLEDGATAISGGASVGPELGGFIYFRGTTSANGGELWKTDGTEAGTSLVRDIRPGASSSQAGALTPLGNKLVFIADNGTVGSEPWVTDGTTAGTILLRDISAGPSSSGASGFEDLGNGRMLFRASDGIPGGGRVGVAIWATDGTPGGTVLVKDLRPTAPIASSPMGSFHVIDNKAVFSAFDDTFGWELFVSDGTAAGTFMLKDINPDTLSYNHFGFFKVLGDRVIFEADDGIHGQELWITDGTAAGTMLLKDVRAGADTSGIITLISYAGRPGEIFFTADDGVHGRELWVTDGTAAGTRLVVDLVPGAAASDAVVEGVLADGRLLLLADDGVHGRELWVSDGTAAGTSLLKDINPGGADSDPVSGNPGSSSSFARDPTPFLNGFIFLANDGVHGDELWFTNGTTAGTRLIKDTAPGDAHFSAREFRVIGDQVFMRALDQVTGTELWVSDGTAAGTRLVKDINDIKLGSAPSGFFTFDFEPSAPPTATNDGVTIAANAPSAIAVLANDSDPDGGDKFVTQIADQAATVGQAITLASGATVALGADGAITYNPNAQFDRLISTAKAAATGAVNVSANDSFSYTLNGGSIGTVSVTVNGVDDAGDWLVSPVGNAVMNGTSGNDLFFLVPSANLTVTDAGAGNDGFYFGATFGAGDSVNGGVGTDQVGLQGTYANLTLGSNALLNVELIVLLPGNDTRFADIGGVLTSYTITTVDANAAAGRTLIFQANTLRAGETLTLNGSAELDAFFLTFGGLGTEDLRGGQQGDGFYFGTGRFNPGDAVNGQGGSDQLGLQGDFAGANALTLGASQLTSVEFIVLLSAADTRFGGGNAGQNFSYTLTTHNGNVAAGQQIIIQANSLRASEELTFDGSAELDGSFRLFGGAAADTIVGGHQADDLTGNSGADRIEGRGGADTLRGGADSDLFIYRAISHSTTAASDRIMDFATGDLIDLSALDANSSSGGLQNFDLIAGGQAFTAAGQLRISQTGSNALIEGDSNGDGIADFAIEVTISDSHTLTLADFAGVTDNAAADLHLFRAEPDYQSWRWTSHRESMHDFHFALTADLMV